MIYSLASASTLWHTPQLIPQKTHTKKRWVPRSMMKVILEHHLWPEQVIIATWKKKLSPFLQHHLRGCAEKMPGTFFRKNFHVKQFVCNFTLIIGWWQATCSVLCGTKIIPPKKTNVFLLLQKFQVEPQIQQTWVVFVLANPAFLINILKKLGINISPTQNNPSTFLSPNSTFCVEEMVAAHCSTGP